MKLVIVESPNKTKTIKSFLGDEYIVTATKGSFRDLAMTGKGNLGVDVDNGEFTPTYEIANDKIKIIESIQKLVDKCDYIYLATDPDREGEAISYHLSKVLNFNKNQIVKRVEFHEITKNHVLKAIEEPRDIDLNLFYSQEARRIMDRIIGFELSTLLQRKIKSKSAGRVQSAVLAIVCEKEKEIQEFVPEYNYDIVANLEDGNLVKLKYIESEEVKLSLDQATKILPTLDHSLICTDIEKKESVKKNKPALTTSGMLMQAFIDYKFPAKKTMKLAQELFEGISIDGRHVGLITYMRTDSTRLSNLFVHEGKKLIVNLFGEDYRYKDDDFSYFKVNDANSQGAHEAIRPTDLRISLDNLKEVLTPDQYKLYLLIYYRALGALMKQTKLKEISYKLSLDNYHFMYNTSEVVFDGVKALGKYLFKERISKPQYKYDINQILNVNNYSIEENSTKPPFRYNEGSLVEKMKQTGIGRPSTYAPTIDTLLKRKYVEKENDYLKPTIVGTFTCNKLGEFFAKTINVTYTAYLETELDKIASGNLDKNTVLSNLYKNFSIEYNKAEELMEKIKGIETGEFCPDCGAPLIFNEGKYGQYISCSEYPTCKYIKKDELDEVCPKCGVGKLIKRKGRFGYFKSCNRYPECDYKATIKFTKK